MTGNYFTPYVYDAFNRLIHKELDVDGDGTGTATDTFWIHDGNQAVLQFDGDTAADLSHRYLWGNAVDQLLADETVDDGGVEDVLWPLTDNLGTVRDLATYDDATDTTTIANHKAYDAFGNVRSETNSAVDTLFGYTGRMWDDDTGQQNNLNRWYDPTTGRWISEDPIGFAADDPNLSRYVGNNVTGTVDPSGLDGAGSCGMLGFAEHYKRRIAEKEAQAPARRAEYERLHQDLREKLFTKLRSILGPNLNNLPERRTWEIAAATNGAVSLSDTRPVLIVRSHSIRRSGRNLLGNREHCGVNCRKSGVAPDRVEPRSSIVAPPRPSRAVAAEEEHAGEVGDGVAVVAKLVSSRRPP